MYYLIFMNINIKNFYNNKIHRKKTDPKGNIYSPEFSDAPEEHSFVRQKNYYRIMGAALLCALMLLVFSPLINARYQRHYISEYLGDAYRGNMLLRAPELPLIEEEEEEIIEVDYSGELTAGVDTRYQGVKITIPRLSVTANVVPPPQTYSAAAYTNLLRQGPVFLTGTVPPGAVGNVVITGHRVSHGYYFVDLDFLEEGDEIILETPDYHVIYKFAYSTIVNEYDWSLLNDHSEVRRIVLHTCDPKTTYQHTPHRLIVRGVLDRIIDKPAEEETEGEE